MLTLYLLVDGSCRVAKDKILIFRGGISGAYSELVWQGVDPQEITTAFKWFIESGHDVARFGVNKTCLFTEKLISKKKAA